MSESALSVALYDLDATRLIAVSAVARRQLGLDGLELESFDFVKRSRAPELVRSLVSMIKSEELTEWHLRSQLRLPDGTPTFGYAHGRRVRGFGERVICLVRYTLGESSEDDWDTTVLLDHDTVAMTDPHDDRRLADHVTRLRRHLARIAHELEAAGVVAITNPPEPSAIPGLTDLSTRQWEVVTRLARGERVATIAREMFLSPNTVRNHLATIYRKVGVRSQAELLELLHQSQRRDK